MANAFTQNPIILDTVMTTTYKNQATVTANIGTLFTLVVEKILWVPSTTTSSFTITDGAATNAITLLTETLVASVPASPQIEFLAHPKLWKDFLLTAITAGDKLYLYVR